MSDKRDAALKALIEAANRIPILAHGLAYDMCLGCGVQEGDPDGCYADCWARELELALEVAMDVSGMVQDADRDAASEPASKDPKAN